MKSFSILVTLICCLLSCNLPSSDFKSRFLTEEIPGDLPIQFMEGLTPAGMLIHRGVFSPDYESYYYTISDSGFERFDVYVIHKNNGNWSAPRKAFFNSSYSEHGMSFSPDGNSLYFSSTRPVKIEGVSESWHIWKSEKRETSWSDPTYVDIPNLRGQLASHPSITESGTLYFHSSNVDYSEMAIFHSKQSNGQFENAEKTAISMTETTANCTPYVSPQEDYLIFASINNELDLMISYRDKGKNWGMAKPLSNEINQHGQGNPYVTPDHQFLFYTTESESGVGWQINWVNVEGIR